MLTSCKESIKENQIVTLTGIANDINQIEIILYNTPPKVNQQQFLVEVNHSNFSLNIPLKTLHFGFIKIKNKRYDLCLIPGDNIQIEIINDSIKYTGKGSEKNNFLYSARKNKLSNDSYYNKLNKAKVLPVKFPSSIRSFKRNQIKHLNSYPKKNELESSFIEYYKILNQLNYERQVIMYPDYYARRNKINSDSIEFPKEHKILSQFSNIISDSKLVSGVYINIINELIYDKTENLLTENSSDEDWFRIHRQIMFDSLSGKTQKYVLLDWINSSLKENQYDTIAIKKFNSLKKDSISSNILDKAISLYKAKPKLIGTLPTEFKNTELIDSTNNEVKFGEVISKLKGSVVYLDIWTTWCAPCRKEMPYSKKLKKKLGKNNSIEFIYISAEKSDIKKWELIYELSLTKKNHYVYKKGFKSKMLDFMNISGVPAYMIFDKEGKLVDYDAERPSDKNLEERLLKLVNE